MSQSFVCPGTAHVQWLSAAADMMCGCSMTAGPLEQGRRLAAVLAGSWRPVPPQADFAAVEWDATVDAASRNRCRRPGLVAGARLGAAAPAGIAKTARRLSHALARSRHARAVDRRGLRPLPGAGVEPLLAKGWAVARLYPEPGLRPFGDIDLFVRPEEYAAAETALAGFRPRRLLLDLQRGFPDLADHPLQEVFAHSRSRSAAGSRCAPWDPRTSCGTCACTCCATAPGAPCGCAMSRRRSSRRM